MFAINPTDPAPIWRQIEDGVRRLIALGALQPGVVVPSVRDLARDLRVNPNTVARAYQRLTDAGVVSVKRGEGTFVADSQPQTRKAARNEMLREGANRYAGTVITTGATVEDAVGELESSYQRLVRELRRKA